MASVIAAGTTSNTALNMTADTSGILQFQTNGTTTAMTLNTSQQVGIGTASPSRLLEVSGATGISRVTSTTGTNAVYREFSNTGGVNLIGTESSAGATLFTGTAAYSFALGTVGAYPLSFATNNSEKMRLDSSGQLILSTNPSTLWFGSTSGSFVKGTNTGGYLIFGYNASEYARFDSSGNLLVGNTTTMGRIGSTLSSATTTFSSLGYGMLSLMNSSNTNNNYSWITFAESNGSYTAAIGSLNEVHASASTSVVGSLVFATKQSGVGGFPVERMRIDSSGNLLVGATSTMNGTYCPIQGQNSTANQVGYFRNTNASPYGVVINYFSAAPNNAGNSFLTCADSSVNRALIYANGGLANYSANNTNLSDVREKKDINPAKDYLNILCQIPVKTFLLNDQTDTDLNLGVIAQDVQAVAPELVTESDWSANQDGSKVRLSVYETDMKYAMLKAIQELNTLVTAQAAEIAALKQKVGV